jgi:hypothetical protein
MSGRFGKVTCPGPSRRDFLRVGVLGGLGLTLGDYFTMRAHADQPDPAPGPKAESAIFIFMAGGMSHLDTFDPKPYAPIEYRGELGTVKTNTGDVFGGLLQNLAKSGRQNGRPPFRHPRRSRPRTRHPQHAHRLPAQPGDQYPSMGSVVAHEYEPRNNLPSYIAIPCGQTNTSARGTSTRLRRVQRRRRTSANENFQVRDLNLPKGVEPIAWNAAKASESGRRTISNSNKPKCSTRWTPTTNAPTTSSARNKPAKPSTSPPNPTKCATLTAARSSDNGCCWPAGWSRLAPVSSPSWTAAGTTTPNMRGAMKANCRRSIKALAMLLSDLQNRGMLEKTMVILSTEFGRTVKLNQDAGRDHWPKAFSVHARRRRHQRRHHPRRDGPIRRRAHAGSPVGPEDISATIFTQLGINPEDKLMSPGDRPIDIVRHGKVISNVVA